MVKKQKLEKEFKENHDAGMVIELEENLRNLKEKKKQLKKEIIDLSYEHVKYDKEKAKTEHNPEDPNDADYLLYKIRALKKKREKLEQENDKDKDVMEKLMARIEESKIKIDKEQQAVDIVEQKYNAKIASQNKNNKTKDNEEDISDYSTNKEKKEISINIDHFKKLKSEAKSKKLELEKLFIELHERDKENRLLNLKVKELERMMPHNSLNPMSRDKSQGFNKRKRRMKNSSINDANKSVLVTEKEQKLRQLRKSNKSPLQDKNSKFRESRELNNEESKSKVNLKTVHENQSKDHDKKEEEKSPKNENIELRDSDRDSNGIRDSINSGR